jgi:hypothetical protein
MAESDHPSEPPKGAERRSAPRLPRHEQVFARVATCPAHPDLVGTVLRAASEDLSRGGLRVRIDRPMDVGTVFDLWLKIKDAEGTFLLHGTVRWLHEAEVEGDYYVGIQLWAGDEPRLDDLEPWDATLEQAGGG